MAHLLDTPVWIWSQVSPEKLGATTEALLLDPEVSLCLSTISTLELARLAALGKVEISGNPRLWINQSLDLLLCSTIELSHEIATEAYSLPGDFHRDPADRILVATARIHQLTLLTADQRILTYPHVASQDARQ